MSMGRQRHREGGPALRFLSPEEAHRQRQPEWLVEGVLPVNSLALWYGKADTYKTFAAIDLAACIGTGQPWHGHRVLKPGGTAYVVAEGEDAFPARVHAWADERHVGLAATRLYQLHQAVDLLDDDSIDALIAGIKRVERQTHAPVRLCVVDTLSMCLGKGKEVGDLGAVSAILNRVRRETGATILLMHHEGLHTGRARGDTTLEGNWAVRVRLTRLHEYECKLVNQKQSNAPKFAPLTLRLTTRTVPLHSGEETTTLSVVPDSEDMLPASAVTPDDPRRAGVDDDVAAVTLVRLGRTGPAAFGRELGISRQAAGIRLRSMVGRGWAVPVGDGTYEPTPHLRRSCPLAA